MYLGGFAPPASYSFAPPPEFSENAVPPPPPPADAPEDTTGEDAWLRRARIGMSQYRPESHSPAPPPPPPPLDGSDDTTGEDAYLRRMRMSGTQANPSDESAPPAPSMDDYNSPSPPEEPLLTTGSTRPPQPAKPAGRSILDFATISSAAVRYEASEDAAKVPASEDEPEEMAIEEENLPEINTVLDPDEPEIDEPARSSNRPGQKGFAERYMAKFGYTKGTGLGATGNGIITPLLMKAEKRKRLPDAEGGGFVDRGGRGKIVGGKKAKVAGESEESKYGKMSETILLRGMLDGMDLLKEIEDGLYQKIGDRCSKVTSKALSSDQYDPTAANVRSTARLSGYSSIVTATPPPLPSSSNIPTLSLLSVLSML
jgi:splicing factor 45